MPNNSDEPIDPRSVSVVNNLFSGTPPADPPPNDPPVDDPPPNDPPPNDPPPNDPPPAEDVDDWDKPLNTPVKNDPPPDDDEEPKDETMARKMAKEKGREAKQLAAQLSEHKLNLERAEKEREEYKARLEEIETTRLNPMEHPDFVKLRSDVMADVEQAAELLPISDPAELVNNFGPFMDAYLKLDGLSGKERAEGLSKLKGLIVDKLAGQDLPYEEMELGEREAFNNLTTSVLSVVQRNVRTTKELVALSKTLTEKAKTGQLSMGVKGYEAAVKEFSPILDTVGDLADDVIEANPHSPEAVVAKIAKASPEGAKRLAKAKEQVLSVLVGPRALTQQEIDKMEANGTDVKEFVRERVRAHKENLKKLAPLMVQALMTRSVFKSTLEELSKLKGEKDAEDSELDILRTTSRKPAPKAPDKKSDMRPVDKLFS